MLLIEIIPDVGKEAGFAPERFRFRPLVCLLPHPLCPALATNSLSTHRILRTSLAWYLACHPLSKSLALCFWRGHMHFLTFSSENCSEMWKFLCRSMAPGKELCCKYSFLSPSPSLSSPKNFICWKRCFSVFICQCQDQGLAHINGWSNESFFKWGREWGQRG